MRRLLLIGDPANILLEEYAIFPSNFLTPLPDRDATLLLTMKKFPQHVKYRFSFDSASLAQQKLQVLEGKRYLDGAGQVKTVKKVIITPYERSSLLNFVKEPNLFTEHKEILRKYPGDTYAILIFTDAPNLYIEYFTIEDFELQFGLHPEIMEMIVGLAG